MSAKTARDEFVSAAFWHRSTARSNAILALHPEIAAQDIYVAAMLGDDVAVRQFLDVDPSLAAQKSGPLSADALTHLCFSAYLAHDRDRSDQFVRAAAALLDAGANANTGFFDASHQPQPEWESALYGAAGFAFHPGLTRLLLERGADPNDAEVPYHSPETTDNAALTILLESGTLRAESLNVMLLRKTDWHDFEGVQLVLKHGGNPNAMTQWGRTALHNSVLSDNDLRIVELLLDAGGDPSIVADDLRHGGDFRTGRSVTALAARRGRADVLHAIERRGIALNLTGVDVVIAACARSDASSARDITARHPELLRELLADGAELLAEFAGTSNATGVSLLLDLGVPVDARYHGDSYMGIAKDSTALHVAAWRASHDVVDVLVACGAAVNARDGKGRTPLMLAVMACVDSYWKSRRSPRSVRALLRAGASQRGVPIPTGYDEVDDLLSTETA